MFSQQNEELVEAKICTDNTFSKMNEAAEFRNLNGSCSLYAALEPHRVVNLDQIRTAKWARADQTIGIKNAKGWGSRWTLRRQARL